MQSGRWDKVTRCGCEWCGAVSVSDSRLLQFAFDGSARSTWLCRRSLLLLLLLDDR